MAISTYKTFLMKKETETWKKVIDIKEFPDLGGAPENLETTTLSDRMQTYIAGIQSLDALEFSANSRLKILKHCKSWRVRRKNMPCGSEETKQAIP